MKFNEDDAPARPHQSFSDSDELRRRVEMQFHSGIRRLHSQ